MGGFAIELAGLNCPNRYEFACFKTLPALSFCKSYKNVYIYLGQITDFTRKKIMTFQIKPEEHAGGVPRHARNK
jgi:hypothetical protein